MGTRLPPKGTGTTLDGASGRAFGRHCGAFGFGGQSGRRAIGPRTPAPASSIHAQPCRPVPLEAAGKPVNWWFAYKFSAATYPGDPAVRPTCSFGGAPRRDGTASSQRYVYATSANPVLRDGPGLIGTTGGDPLGCVDDDNNTRNAQDFFALQLGRDDVKAVLRALAVASVSTDINNPQIVRRRLGLVAAPADLDLRAAQVFLTYLGANTGGIDGINGPSTSAALKVYQTANGLFISGPPDAATLASLATRFN